MMRFRTPTLVPLLALALALPAQDLRKLPEWAVPHAQAAAQDPAPADADAWVLLDRIEMAYAGGGEIRVRHLSLIKVLTERGRHVGTFSLWGLGGGANRIKKLKGWNLRADGELLKLDTDKVATVDTDLLGASDVSTHTRTLAHLDEVAKGSLVAFESLEIIRHPMGPVIGDTLLGAFPVRRYELELARQATWLGPSLEGVALRLDPRHLSPWIPAAQVDFVQGSHLRAWNLPALPRDEGAHPPGLNASPWVLVRFLDPAFREGLDHTSWDALAQGMNQRYQPFFRAPELGLPAGEPQARLKAAWAWMHRELGYRAVYLSPERGWIPEQPEETQRRRYGDCKDLATFFMGQAKALGLAVAPVLVQTVGGALDPDEPPFFGRFNHAIAAVRLDRSWGLPAEVETSRGRYLLVDGTDAFTPFGQLSTWLLGCRVLICAPEGAAWAEIKPSHCLGESLDLELRAKVDEVGTLRGTWRVLETGNARSLRGTLVHQGREGLRKALLQQSPLPPTGTLEITGTSDPKDLDKPFEITCRIVHPKALVRNGQEVELAPWGMPGIPAVLQKGDTPRVYPVHLDRRGGLHLHVEVEFPYAAEPVLPEASLASPWRKGTWKASAGPGNRVVLDYVQEGRLGDFPYASRNEGMAAWKKDRTEVRRLHLDGLSFKVKP